MAISATFEGSQTGVVGKANQTVARLTENIVGNNGLMGKCADGREIRQADSMIPDRFKRGETPVENPNEKEQLTPKDGFPLPGGVVI
ncbi:MAG: hypothetical protein WC890_01315 [Candidatus Margulisiibacteriota bacterium]